MRLCYSNEVKSAKEIKIYLRQEIPEFYPTIGYNLNMNSLHQLEMRSKKPERALHVGEIAYNDEMDRWILSH